MRLSRFFGRILPEVKRGVEIVTKTRRAWPLQTYFSAAIFVNIFFVGNYFHSKSPCFLGPFFLLTLRTIKTSYLYNKFIFYNHCIKFFWGLLAAGTKATAGNGWGNGMGRD